MLLINNVSKTYKGGKVAVDNISLHINKGDIFGFIGHNGAGKTTMIRMVVGILDFENGEIFIDGSSIKSNPLECKRKFAYIPDNPDIYEHLTGIQYLDFIGNVYNVEKAKKEALIKKYTGIFEITNNLGDLISTYSHGMRQKLAITSALIHEPKLLILDEPFVGLDPKASHSLKEIMKELCDNGGAIFFSTHVLDVAEKLCNKIAIIKNGKLVMEGNTNEILNNKSLEDIFMELV
ncbi:ABC transporter ATP-binding protein [Eubacteriales bacterium OttesenSCG-928-G02]|nr:ABC transporter ATP-binding protein [Eubacteriales bacterium OttesenSCG-928-G02]